MMASQRFVQLAQADAAPSSTLFPATNGYPLVCHAHGYVFIGAITGANAFRMEKGHGFAR